MHQLGTTSNTTILQPEAPEALQRDVVHAAGNVYNSAWLTGGPEIAKILTVKT